MIRVGIVGASGYMGGEVLRILLNHPQVEIAWISARNSGDISLQHPNLYGTQQLLIRHEDITPVDVAFVALPTEASITLSRKLLDMGSRVIDLGAAFRLEDQVSWERVYAMSHPDWALSEEAVYGISELHLDEIRQSRLIANPGCFASAGILALAPLMSESLIDKRSVHITGISGSAGAGAELNRAAHHPELGNNLVAYNVVDHRHSYEMEQELSRLAREDVCVHFTPVYAPITRGIMNLCHVQPTVQLTREQWLERFRRFYAEHPFVQIYDQPFAQGESWQYRPYPWISAVSGTNRCQIGLDLDQRRNRLLVISVLDSMGKGGAQVGIENMNLMYGLERTTGLHQYAMHP